MITAEPGEEVRDAAFSAGASDLICKPARGEDIIFAICRHAFHAGPLSS